MSLIFVLLIGVIFSAFLWTISKMVLEGKWEYSIYFLVIFLPFYTNTLSLAYLTTESTFIVKMLQSLKEIVTIGAFGSFIIFQKNIFKYPFRLHQVDYMYLSFVGLGFVFLFLPLGEASFLNKILYFKNMLIPALVYFLGRNTNFRDDDIHLLFKGIFIIAIGAFCVNLIEISMDKHLQTFTGYSEYVQVFANYEPSGNFGLTWTFETQAVTKRLASFFSDPLELASSVLLGFSAGLIWFLTSKRAHWLPYTFVVFCSFGSLIFASSRAAFMSFFVMLFFIAVIFKLYRLIIPGIILMLLFVAYVLFLASDDFYYFVVDTITFENPSSAGHLVEWIIALESMVNNPLGVGLAMSGNLGSVTDEVRIGGENQFLIYGVQLGWIGMFLYIFTLFSGIRTALKVFHKTTNTMTARIAFVGATVKFGLLLPLFTANAEVYTYVSWVTWWMIGYSVKAYQEIYYQRSVL